MEKVQEPDSLTSLESTLVVDILEELISGLELYSHVLPRGRLLTSTLSKSLETRSKDHASFDENERCSNELECSTELENLRQMLKLTNVPDRDGDDAELLTESIKTHQDLAFLIQILSRTKSELESKNTYTHLEESVREESREQSQESILKSHLKSKEEDVKRLQREIADFEKKAHENEQEEMCQLNNLKDELHLLKQQGESDRSFAKVWLTARNEYERRGHKDDIGAKSSRMNSIRSQIIRDCNSYENVTAWTKLISGKLEQKIGDWKMKFQSDVYTLEQRIAKKRKNIEEQQERIACLEGTIGERMVELAPWDEEKVKERQQRLDHMRRFYSCRRIQRWWRKYMISRGLYKKKKPKPKATKAKVTKPGRKGK